MSAQAGSPPGKHPSPKSNPASLPPTNSIAVRMASDLQTRLRSLLAGRRGDVVLLGLLLLPAYLFLHVTPEFAANLPQDASDFAVPAVNLLEQGKLGQSAFGQMYEMGHPF